MNLSPMHNTTALALRRGISAVGLFLLTWACTPNAPAPVTSDTSTTRLIAPPVQLIDSAIPPAIAGEGGWNYQQSVNRDLNGDGLAERVVLTARVEMYRGQPAWDDGQPWQVYVVGQDSTRTYLYARRLQLGTLEMRVSRSNSGETARVVLLEQLPDRLSVYESAYDGPSRVTTTLRYQRDLDSTGDTSGSPGR